MYNKNMNIGERKNRIFLELNKNIIEEIISIFEEGNISKIKNFVTLNNKINININLGDDNDDTISHIILNNENMTETDKYELIKYLINNNNLNINKPNKYNILPIHIVAKNQYINIYNIFAKYNIKYSKDNYGLSQLHYGLMGNIIQKKKYIHNEKENVDKDILVNKIQNNIINYMYENNIINNHLSNIKKIINNIIDENNDDLTNNKDNYLLNINEIFKDNKNNDEHENKLRKNFLSFSNNAYNIIKDNIVKYNDIKININATINDDDEIIFDENEIKFDKELNNHYLELKGLFNGIISFLQTDVLKNINLSIKSIIETLKKKFNMYFFMKHYFEHEGIKILMSNNGIFFRYFINALACRVDNQHIYNDPDILNKLHNANWEYIEHVEYNDINLGKIKKNRWKCIISTYYGNIPLDITLDEKYKLNQEKYYLYFMMYNGHHYISTIDNIRILRYMVSNIFINNNEYIPPVLQLDKNFVINKYKQEYIKNLQYCTLMRHIYSNMIEYKTIYNGTLPQFKNKYYDEIKGEIINDNNELITNFLNIIGPIDNNIQNTINDFFENIYLTHDNPMASLVFILLNIKDNIQKIIYTIEQIDLKNININNIYNLSLKLLYLAVNINQSFMFMNDYTYYDNNEKKYLPKYIAFFEIYYKIKNYIDKNDTHPTYNILYDILHSQIKNDLDFKINIKKTNLYNNINILIKKYNMLINVINNISGINIMKSFINNDILLNNCTNLNFKQIKEHTLDVNQYYHNIITKYNIYDEKSCDDFIIYLFDKYIPKIHDKYKLIMYISNKNINKIINSNNGYIIDNNKSYTNINNIVKGKIGITYNHKFNINNGIQEPIYNNIYKLFNNIKFTIIKKIFDNDIFGDEILPINSIKKIRNITYKFATDDKIIINIHAIIAEYINNILDIYIDLCINNKSKHLMNTYANDIYIMNDNVYIKNFVDDIKININNNTILNIPIFYNKNDNIDDNNTHIIYDYEFDGNNHYNNTYLNINESFIKKMISKYNIHINDKDNDGKSIIYYVIDICHLDIAKYIINNSKYNNNIYNLMGISPLKYCLNKYINKINYIYDNDDDNNNIFMKLLSETNRKIDDNIIKKYDMQNIIYNDDIFPLFIYLINEYIFIQRIGIIHKKVYKYDDYKYYHTQYYYKNKDNIKKYINIDAYLNDCMLLYNDNRYIYNNDRIIIDNMDIFEIENDMTKNNNIMNNIIHILMNNNWNNHNNIHIKLIKKQKIIYNKYIKKQINKNEYILKLKKILLKYNLIYETIKIYFEIGKESIHENIILKEIIEIITYICRIKIFDKMYIMIHDVLFEDINKSIKDNNMNKEQDAMNIINNNGNNVISIRKYIYNDMIKDILDSIYFTKTENIKDTSEIFENIIGMLKSNIIYDINNNSHIIEIYKNKIMPYFRDIINIYITNMINLGDSYLKSIIDQKNYIEMLIMLLQK
jgi:hypothetical protein